MDRQWKAFASHLTFQTADFDDPLVYSQLVQTIGHPG